MGLGVGSFFMRSGIMTDADEVSIDAITLFVALLCACIVIGHLLEENRWFNESITSLFIVRSRYILLWLNVVLF